MLNVPLPKLLRKLEQGKANPLTPVTMQVAVHEEQVAYLREHRTRVPGRRHERRPTCAGTTPQALLAHVLGYVGELTPAQLADIKKHYGSCALPRAKELNVPCAGDRVGQTGVEKTYDKYLRGRSGEKLQRVNSFGAKVDKAPVVTAQPTTGAPVQLTIDISLQRAAERALQYGIRLAHEDNHWLANGGAIVAMNPNNGEILATASAPTFKPGIFVGRTDPKKLAPLLDPTTAKKDNYPGLNRVTEGLYPPGSTFKPVTALAAMQERLISPFQTLQCTPKFEVHGQVFKNWDPFANEPMTLPQALGASCDTYFYNLGYSFYALPPDRGHPLQGWASRFGFGAPTGVDVGPEQDGLLPTPEWRQSTYTKKTDPCCWEIDRLWKPGDSIQLAIGQKDLLVTPLQMVRFYSLIANGGKLVKPHVVEAVGKPGGGMVPLNPPAPEPSNVDPDGARRRPGRPLPRHARLVRHGDRRLRELPDHGRRQDGHRREGRPAAGLRAPAAAGPVVVVRLRARREARARRLRRDRERRPRRHGRRPRRAEGVRALLPQERAADRRHPLRLMAVTYTPTESRGTALAAASSPQDAPLLARLDWVHAQRRRRRSSPTGSGRSPGSRSTTCSATPTTSSTGRSSSSRSARSASSSRS